MNTSTSGTVELDAYVSALRLIFSGVPWKQVEAYAEQGWRYCELGNKLPWKRVSKEIRDAFLAGEDR